MSVKARARDSKMSSVVLSSKDVDSGVRRYIGFWVVSALGGGSGTLGLLVGKMAMWRGLFCVMVRLEEWVHVWETYGFTNYPYEGY